MRRNSTVLSLNQVLHGQYRTFCKELYRVVFSKAEIFIGVA